VDFEVGLGTYASSGGTITRTTVFTSSNSNSAVNWGVGTKNIFLTYPADKAVVEDASNNVTIGNNLVVGGTVDGRDVAADGTKLDFVTVTQAVNLDQMETDIAALENGMVYKGDWNAGSGSFPGSGSAQTGWFYYVSGAGTVNGISFAVGDNIVATTDNASTSTYASNWSKHDQTDAVQAVVGLTGSIAKGSLLSALNVEDGADVTDTANVTSAGALMDSEVTNLAQVKAFNSSDYATAAQGTTANNALPKAGGTMSGNIDGNGNKMLFANMYSNLVDLPSATTYHGMFAHVHATGKAYFAHSGAWVPLANESTTLALAGGTMTGDVLYNDNVKAKFGAGSDLQIYHDGSNSIISDQGTGHIKIYANDFRVTNAGNTEQMITANQDGAVTLYYDSVAKLTTTSTGVQVSGNISNATGNFTLDVAGEINLDADVDGTIRFNDNGTNFGMVYGASSNFTLISKVQDKDMIFQGNDGGSTITALTLDMSTGGTAYFADDVRLTDNHAIRLGTDGDIVFYHDNSNGYLENSAGDLTLDVAGDIILDADGDDIQLKAGAFHFASITKPANNGVEFRAIGSDRDMFFKGNDGGSEITALTLDMSDGGTAIFNQKVVANSSSSGDYVRMYGGSGTGKWDIYGHGANLRISDNENAGAVQFDTNVGIGTSSPATKLDVNGDGLQIRLDGTANTSRGIMLRNTGSAEGQIQTDGNMHFIQEDAGKYMRFSTANTERMRIDSSGNLLVGTTTYNGPVNASSGDYGAAIWEGGLIAAGTNASETLALNRMGSDGDIAVFKRSGSTVGSIGASGGNLTVNSSSTGLLRTGGTNRYSWDNDQFYPAVDGSKNLGTSSLRFQHGYFSGNLYGNGSNLTGITDTTYSAGAGLDLSGTTFSVESDQRGEIHLFGISSTDYINSTATYFDFVLDGAVDMRLSNNGDLHVEGNVVAYSTAISDERLKKDIVKIDNALDKVSQLNGYTFEYLTDGKKSAGVIAQEVEKVMPSAITETTLPVKMGEDDETEYKTVQYDQLHGLLIEAIKELKAEIEELKAR
jgi:hypothetical protein